MEFDPKTGPTVAQIIEMAGGKTADQDLTDRLILTMHQFVLLHEIAMADFKEGHTVSALDIRLETLHDFGFIKQLPSGRWQVTEKGMRHLRPDLYRSHAREQKERRRK